MGIRTPHRRTAPAPAQANTDRPHRPPRPAVPVIAPGASTARLPADLVLTPRHAAAEPRRRLRRWARLAAGGYLAPAVTLVRRSRPRRLLTVVAAATAAVAAAAATAAAEDGATGPLTGPPDGSAPDRRHLSPYCQELGPDATA